ncbi:hypothetical protein A3A55_00725 [Candidatus Roizmanbacteria bacterium RIFCSPLOWO2_01_FULL_40_14]|uniref:Uncharacterized protein n=2 Tax=Candidatus Roizmaniibacteriota TaxID=1752723 RepID=A0A0G0ZLJ3_9BACT|nr:MAG: hypothetical protein UU41_C0048G0004 [Candidatus Roizmanbacteria bacterium GW2011_GWA1_41_13]KKS22936.1 MAG: hypothetical protein UU78_C0009G0014 [Candidatus Roizmanbacteria bacterium GW2011_GWC2_41_7]OGK48592.1 MAG: hypothetical protein A3A55_00725 [Candidatus Roizmanbacteria bacterium RIFCSPLOWO2_01_FULL_40_14]
MYRFLDELTASSLRRRSIIDQYVGRYADDDYVKVYTGMLAALRKGLPSDPVESFPWEQMIGEADTRLTHWMKFVDTEYKELIKAHIRITDLTKILLTLTPDHAYVIRLFNPKNSHATIGDLRKWAREYWASFSHLPDSH